MAKYPFPLRRGGRRRRRVSALFSRGRGAVGPSWTASSAGTSPAGSLFAENPGGQLPVSPGFIVPQSGGGVLHCPLYHSDGRAPPSLTLRPILSDEVPALAVNVDGQIARFTRSSLAAKRVAWPARNRRLPSSGELGGREREIPHFRGRALFRLFGAADWQGEVVRTVRWRLPAARRAMAPLGTFRVTTPRPRPC
jgi:hypothetical protein